MKTSKILTTYLDKSIIKKSIDAGGNKDNYDYELAQKILKSRLEKNSSFNNKLIIIYLSVLGMVLILVSILIWWCIIHEKDTWVWGLLSGEGLSIAMIIREIRRIYKDKTFSDLMLYSVPKLKTEKDIENFFNIIKDFLK